MTVEVGSGMGETTVRIAAAHPERDYLAIEVHAPGVGSLLKQVSELGLTNVRVVQHDAVEVLRDMVPAGSLAGIHVFFPDPWPKKRHVKRRLLRPSVAALMADRLASQGFLHLATDWPAYADHAREVLSGWDVVEDRRDRLVTGYERRALAAGREPVDLVCRPPV